MSNEVSFEHSVGGNLDYSFDWLSRGWLAAGETISTSVWAITGSSDAVLSNDQNIAGVTSVFVKLSTAHNVYRLINTITTSAGRIDSRTIVLSCVAR